MTVCSQPFTLSLEILQRKRTLSGISANVSDHVRVNTSVSARVKLRKHDQVFLENFSLTKSLAQKLVMPVLKKSTCQGKLVNFWRTHEQIKLAKEKLVKEILVVCMGL